MMKGRLILLVLVLMIPLISSQSNLTASIGNPRMVLYKNIVTGDTLTFENKVIVDNVNDHDVSISIIPRDVWENKVELSEKEFIMSPGERKEVPYTVTIKEPGYYRGDIFVEFKDGSGDYLTLAQDLVVIVQDELGNVDTPKKEGSNGLVFGLGGLVVLMVVLIFILNKRRTKK